MPWPGEAFQSLLTAHTDPSTSVPGALLKPGWRSCRLKQAPR